MSMQTRLLSAIFTTIPAAVAGILIHLYARGEYYWTMYHFVAVAFPIASLLIGFFLPNWLQNYWLRHPGWWLLGQGIAAWIIAILMLGLLTLTPLCVGQDNGDGINDLEQCIAQTVAVSIVYSPLESILLCLSAVTGGWLIKQFCMDKETR